MKIMYNYSIYTNSILLEINNYANQSIWLIQYNNFKMVKDKKAHKKILININFSNLGLCLIY